MPDRKTKQGCAIKVPKVPTSELPPLQKFKKSKLPKMSTIVFEFWKNWNFEAFWISSTGIVEVVKDLLLGATKTFYVKRQVGSKSFLSSLILEEEAELLIQRTSLFVPLT